ncbi:Outer membrane protein YfgL, lipoprotein component of the protein assembly complex (forms a complex with YaeT, YfiO, and NlpB) [Escherichia coli ISC7]|uniref:Outer membrane protein YfgL, lipoprotein component of the protein assembly complex (Forms a complex with YaeT, YfiO, and NlpB) n=1 Tax=Escherichia coli ISC7 TaxID=1432555 RepID=W1ET68_ECOLX|nr:Outer membrane protein YfgL, lipoprotein component of the protein assembly complex (forms a complex with YaeT, YfiO, and NlpB) [Escherichia coli ISC7]
MQLRKLLLPGLLSVTLLSGCSLFNSEEDVVKMSPLPTVENQFTPTRRGALPLVAALATSIPIFIRHWRTTLSMQRTALVW